MSVKYKGKITTPYQTKVINKPIFVFLVAGFFLTNQYQNQSKDENKSPPIHAPVIKSSIPNHRQSPTPAIAPIVQTGQTA